MDQPWIYIVLFGLVFIVYAKIMPKNASKGQQNATINEIEETMEHFTAELEEQNKALIQLLAETKRDYELQSAKLSARVETLEKQADHTGGQLAKLAAATEELQKQTAVMMSSPVAAAGSQPASHTAVLETMAASVDPVPEDKPEPVSVSSMNMKVRYADLFTMYDQGKSTDYIAKKLNMNKGEVNLIIQLAKQEERLNAH